MKSRMMRNKELKALYGGISGWFIAAVMILVVGIGAMLINFNGNDSRIAQTLDTILPMYALVIPLFTMNTVSKEVQNGTIQYIDSIPGAGKAMLLGKFQAKLLAFSMPFVIICLLPLVFSLYGDVQLISSYASIFVFWLLGVMLMALGILISVYSENNKVAAAVTFCLIAIDYLLPSAAKMLPSGNVVQIVKNLSVFHYYRYYAVNYVNIRAILVYVVLLVLFLMLAVRRMNQRRADNGKKYAGTAITAVALVVCIAVNLLPAGMTMVDLSPAKMITLSDTSKEIMEKLDTDVEIRYVARQGEENRTVEQILARLEESSPYLTVKQVEGSAEEYEAGTVIVRANKNMVLLNSMEAYEYNYANYMTTGTMDSYFKFERALVTIIHSMTEETVPTFYWVTNHMEMELEYSMESYFYQSGLRLADLNLEEGIPSDAAGLVIASPALDFSDNEVSILQSYLKQGGYLMLLTDMSGMEMPNLDRLMQEYGVYKQNGLIIEGSTNHMANPEYPYYILPNYLDHELFGQIKDLNMPVAMMMAHGIGYNGTESETIKMRPALLTSELSYMKFGVDIASLEPSEDDMPGPFLTGVTIEDTQSGAQILWFASSSMLVEACNEAVGNTDIKILTTFMKNACDYEVPVIEDKLMVGYEMDFGSSSTGKWNLLMMGLPMVFLVIGLLNKARSKS